MSMSDPISDMLTRIRNAQSVQKKTVLIPASKVKTGIASVLKNEGYIADYRDAELDGKPGLEVTLKYVEGRGVIETMKRASRPGLRQYRGKDDLPKIQNGLGIAVISTSTGIMTDAQARAAGQGGEILCIVT
ncbi:MAG: 30S ribosomal protein S8 [Xanthomonadales bacterium]|nr:30S ribosomal protein S8 [Gammaproteobacteria bacterium]MBT8052027.1 30S ribosomal protein S8 [Gammaproteobacteria bacterium]MBT8056788.1 30S ribosomal protein S8 [Gammaproteobacteria bacterium]NNJ78165.1 30S ribosomal protein S8 [Xanthomonadales bacterium]NNL04448.1 30S ribosomal protein S8 [Xanthomonadales bacterium]